MTAEQQLNSDVNNDGQISAIDAAFILQYAAAAGSGNAGTFAEYMAAILG